MRYQIESRNAGRDGHCSTRSASGSVRVYQRDPRAGRGRELIDRRPDASRPALTTGPSPMFPVATASALDSVWRTLRWFTASGSESDVGNFRPVPAGARQCRPCGSSRRVSRTSQSAVLGSGWRKVNQVSRAISLVSASRTSRSRAASNSSSGDDPLSSNPGSSCRWTASRSVHVHSSNIGVRR